MQQTRGTLGGIVRQFRLRAGLDQQELSARAGLSVRALRNIEQQRVHRPHDDSLRRLADALALDGADRAQLLAQTPAHVPRLRVGVLGPLSVHHGDEPAVLGAPRPRLLLGALALQAGAVVSRDEMVDLLWQDQPPRSAPNLVHIYVGQLGAVLEPGRGRRTSATSVVRVKGGYRLELDDDQLDLTLFDCMVARAATATAAQAMRCYDGALSAWRGPLLADMDSRLREHPAATAATARRVAATCAAADLAVAENQPAKAVAWLRAVLAAEPLYEALHARLILALARSGEPAMALRHFAALRERLIDELGVEPGADVRAAHLAVLRGELQEPRSEHAAPVNVAPAVSASAVVAQLPLDSRGFVGRADELAQLDAATATARNQPTAATVWVVIGSAGVGKTALAVHWAHRVADQFPDGQLYMNLRGFDPGESPMTPEEAIRGFLDALHVPAYIPPDPEMQAALYRSYLAGKRVLIVLDNAAGAAQVRPLLPGGPTCLVVITSRNQLTSLITREGAHALTLDLLTPQEAAEFLAGRLGHGRIVAEPDAAADIVAHCSRLPLALAMVAARAATRPHFLLRTIAAELRGEPWLDAFRGEDPDTDIRAVFSWSYRRLALPTARLFRLLGLHPGTDISVPAAASLTGCPAVTARQRLEELVRASLLTEYRPGGYTLHDLLRAYAVDLTHSLDSDNAREAALHRLLEHYERTAHTADQVLNPYHDYREPVVLPGPRPEVASEEVVDAERALTWFSAESPTLRRAITLAAGTGRDALAWNLAHSLAIFLDRQGRKDELAATQLDALDAATRRSDSGGQAVSHLLLGRALMWMGRRDEAHPHLTRAAQLHEATGRELGLARSHVDLALLALQTGQFNHAKDQAERSVRLYEANGNEGGRAGALSTLGWCRAYLGDYHRALRDCRQALVLAQRIGDVRSESWAWKGLGHSNQQLGDHQQAIECYRQASGLFRALADRFSEFDVRNRLGDCHFAAGHLAAAGAAWRLALELFVDIEHPEADKVRSKLENLDRPA